MLKTRTMLCGLVCAGLAVGLVSCGGCGTEEGQPGIGNKGQTGNTGGKTTTIKDPVVPVVDLTEEKRKALDGTEWDIDIVRMADTKKKKESDKLRFVNNKVYIEKFDAQGYHASNYSLRVQPDGVVVWETMQTSEDGSTLFLRGDWRGERMTGIIVKHPKKGKNEDFAFVSTGSRKLDKTALEPEKER